MSRLVQEIAKEVLEYKSNANGLEVQMGLIKEVTENFLKENYIYRKVGLREVWKELNRKGYKVVREYSGGLMTKHEVRGKR